MVQASLLGGFRNPFELAHVPFNKTVNAWAFLGAGQTSRAHCVVFPRLTWLCVASPAPSWLSCFHPSWRAAFTRNPVLFSVLGSLLSRGLFQKPCSLEAQTLHGTGIPKPPSPKGVNLHHPKTAALLKAETWR